MQKNTGCVGIIQTSKSKTFPWNSYKNVKEAQDDFCNHFSTRKYYLEKDSSIVESLKKRGCINFLVRFDKHFFILLMNSSIVEETGQIDGSEYSGYIKFSSVVFIEPVLVDNIKPLIANSKKYKQFSDVNVNYYIEDVSKLLELVEPLE